MRLTSDVGLLHDPKYLEIVKEFAQNMSALDEAFDAAWSQLTITEGARWSSAAICDSGKPPEDRRPALKMLGNDLVV